MIGSSSSSSSGHRTGIALAAGGAALFSLKGVVAKLAFAEGAGVEQLMALRMGFALPIYLGIAIWSVRRGIPRHPWRLWFAAAGVGILSHYVCTRLDFMGLQYISAQLERLILFLYPTFTALMARVFLKDRIGPRHIVALLASYVGVITLFAREVSVQGEEALIGAGLVFAAAVLYAAHVTASKPVIARMGSALYTCVAMSAASLVILAEVGVRSQIGALPPLNAPIIAYGVLIATACTVAPSFMIAEAVARVGPGPASAVGGIGPVATAFLAVWLLDEPFGVAHVVALILTTGGVFVLARAGRGGRNAAPPSIPPAPAAGLSAKEEPTG